jgi:hypothetical protein
MRVIPYASAVGSVGVLYPGYCGSPVMTQNSRYELFPPVTNCWGTIHLVSDKAPSFWAKAGPPM